MRVLVLLILVLPTISGFGQTVNFEDDFSDGDFTANPAWMGNTGDFQIHSLNGNQVIRLSGSGASTSYLSTPSSNIVGYWEFFVRIDGTAPSGSNKAEIILVSDIQDLTGSVNGYAVRVGETGDDVFRVVRFDSGSEASIIVSDTTIVQSSSSYRVKVTRDSSGNWSIEVGEGYAGALKNSDNTGTDNTYTTSAYFGFKVDYTSSRTDDFYFDFKIDIPPVEVQDLTVISDTELDVQFSRDIDFSSAQTADFSLNSGNQTPISISQEDSRTVRLNFASAFPGGENSISISDISDLNGETTLSDTTLTFFIYDSYQSGDIVLNEFMYDPPSGSSEYVELRNTSNRYLNLKNWSLGDNGDFNTITSDDLTVYPDSFVVLTDNATALTSYFGPGNYLELSTWRALNNSGTEQVRIIDESGETIDSLEYTSSWGGEEVSLERKDINVTSVFMENWGESPATNSGTPGFANEVESDVTSPEIEYFEQTSDTQLLLIFSERIAQLPAENSANFNLSADKISGLPVLQTAQYLAPDSILLTYDNAFLSLAEGTTYELIIENQSDIFGNTAGQLSESFFVIEYTTADSGDVFITEFMYDPAAGMTDFIELFNSTSQAINLENWTYNDNSSSPRFISSSDFTVFPGERVVLAPDSSLLELFPDISLVDMGSRFSNLNSTTTDDIVIRNAAGTLIDSLTYLPAWGGNEISLERRSTQYSAVFAENWGNSPSENLATPGQPNQIHEDTSPPELHNLKRLSGQQIQLIFSERLQPLPAENTANFSLTADNISSLPSLQSASFSAPDTILLQFDTPLPSQPEGTTYELTISGQQDIFENTSSPVSESFFVIEFGEADSGDVYITEFMYDPATGFTDFIELYNATDEAFNLQDWTYNDDSRNPKALSISEFIFQPGEYVVLSPDSSMLNLFPGITLLEMGSRFANLNSTTADDIVIRNEAGELIDSLTYLPSWGGDGISLERRSLEIASFYQENWGESPSENLATAGATNEVAADTKAPVIASAEVAGSTSLRIIFNERVQQIPAEQISNYQLSSGSSDVTVPDLKSAKFTAPDTVLLNLESSLPREPNGTVYHLQVRNQIDIFGNVSDELTANFFLINYAKSDSGKVFITEFMYDPPEAYSEFIELYNPTDSAFNIKNWSFNDNSGNQRVISDVEYSLNPGNRVILTPDSTIFLNMEDIEFIAMGSRFSSLNNSSDAIVIRNEQGVLLDSLTYSSGWGGDEVSLERKSIEHTSVYRENWGDSPTAQRGTPSKANQISPDLLPPEILAIRVLGTRELQILFSERIQAESASNPANYFVSSDDKSLTLPKLDSLSFQAPDTVYLFFKDDFPIEVDGTSYEIHITNQTDIFGNSSDALSGEFSLIQYANPAPGDIAINEFMYDPPEDYAEFIELVNTSDSTLNLLGWTFNDNTGNRRFITEDDFAITPGEYLILTADSTLYERFPNLNFLAMGSRFSSLNNSSDAIVIRDSSGVLIDSLTYYSNWGGESVSLERIDPDIESIFAENWGNSPDENFATPGRPNAVHPDIAAPVLQNAFILAADTVVFQFNERVRKESATNPENITATPNIYISEILYQSNQIVLVLETPFSDGQTYSFRLQNQEDIFGNIQAEVTYSLTYTELSEAEPGDVIVNEILYRRATAESEEFIELFNQTDHNFNLSQWTFSDATSSATIPDGTQLLAGEYIVLTDKPIVETHSKSSNALLKSSARTENNELTNRAYIPGFPSLNDDEDAVVIKNRDGLVIDSLFYHESWGGNQPGVSLERKDPLSASNDASNWASNTSESGNSLGGESTVFQPDEVPPEIIFARLQKDGRIFVAFSEFVRFNEPTILVNDEPVAIADYQINDANKVILGENVFEDNQALSVTFSQVQDFRGNTARDLSVDVSMPLTRQNIVINEILYDPLANTDDNLPDQTEFIELYNRSEFPVSLEGIYLHDEPDENEEVRTIYPVQTRFKWIPSGGYVVFYADDEATHFLDSKLAKYFEMETVDERYFIRTDRSSLSLGSSDDAVYLADSSGTVIDSVFYDESWQNPNLYDTKGVTLERIDPYGPSNDESNWSSSTRVSGGTPGEENSIYQLAGQAPENTGISFSPNPFSPDDDGFEDNLFINYKLDEPDYLLRVRIFDRYGRLVRKLAVGKQAGFEGSLIWDGNMDNKSRNRVGIYIVLFEAYNSANGKNRTFKETVVIARKF